MSIIDAGNAAAAFREGTDRPGHARSVLLLGLGNDILTDDAIGLNIVRQVRRLLSEEEGIETVATTEMGLVLLDYIVGYRDVVLVDAIQTGKAAPGHLHEMQAEDLKALPVISPHFLGVGETLALGRALGLSMPERVRVFAIEVQDPFTISTQMTTPLRAALPGIVEKVLKVLRELAPGGVPASGEGTRPTCDGDTDETNR